MTAYLLFLNNVIPEDQVLDKQSLPNVRMPLGDEFGKPHEFKLNAPRLRVTPSGLVASAQTSGACWRPTSSIRSSSLSGLAR